MCINKIKTALNNMKLSKILFKRSNEEYKTPPISGISAGEITFNTNDDMPFITIGGKGSSGEINTVNIYRDRFFLNVVDKENTNSDDTLVGIDDDALKKIKGLKISIEKDPTRNCIFLIYKNRVYSINTFQTTNRKKIIFDNLSKIADKIIYSTLTYDESQQIGEWTFTYDENEIKPLTGDDIKLDGYTSELSDDEEKIITANMTINEALQKLEKVTTENEMTVSAAINQINERLRRLEKA